MYDEGCQNTAAYVFLAILAGFVTYVISIFNYAGGSWLFVIAMWAILIGAGMYQASNAGRESTRQDKQSQKWQSNAVVPRQRRYISAQVQRQVWERDGGACVNCGAMEELELDHIIPVSKGGSNSAKNIQLLCKSCNRRKGNRIGGEDFGLPLFDDTSEHLEERISGAESLTPPITNSREQWLQGDAEINQWDQKESDHREKRSCRIDDKEKRWEESQTRSRRKESANLDRWQREWDEHGDEQQENQMDDLQNI